MSSKNNSVFIPRVFKNISKERISELFDKLDIGIVDHIDFVNKQGREGDYYAVYVHFKYWLNTTASRNFRSKLDTKEGAKLVYDDPWYWVILKNTTKDQNNSVKLHNPVTVLPIAPGLNPIIVAGVEQQEPPKSAIMKRLRNANKLKIVHSYTPPDTPPRGVQRSDCSECREDIITEQLQKRYEFQSAFMASL